MAILLPFGYNPTLIHLLFTPPYMEQNTTSLLGKPYWPIDNSQAVCLGNPGNEYYLAGHSMSEPKQQERVEIISELFVSKYLFMGREINDKDFVLVRCQRGLVHSIMFHEAGLEPTRARQNTYAYVM